jgi:hypothetical protein
MAGAVMLGSGDGGGWERREAGADDQELLMKRIWQRWAVMEIITLHE